jgi:hypothetical protein
MGGLTDEQPPPPGPMSQAPRRWKMKSVWARRKPTSKLSQPDAGGPPDDRPTSDWMFW